MIWRVLFAKTRITYAYKREETPNLCEGTQNFREIPSFDGWGWGFAGFILRGISEYLRCGFY